MLLSTKYLFCRTGKIMKVQCKKIRFKQNLCWKLFEIYHPEVFLNQDSNHPVYSRVSFELSRQTRIRQWKSSGIKGLRQISLSVVGHLCMENFIDLVPCKKCSVL